MSIADSICVRIFIACLSSLAACAGQANGEDWRFAPIPGAYYLALDAAPFGLTQPPGLALSGIATFHADRTFVVVDSGDFGGMPFGTLDSPQYGDWRRRGRGVEAVSLFLRANGLTGDVVSWQKVSMALSWDGPNTLTGVVNVTELKCLEPAPFAAFSCADPVAEAHAFTPVGPPDVPVTLKRLRPRGKFGAHIQGK